MENYGKMLDLFDLALWMQEAGDGVSLEDIQNSFRVSRRTAERMRNALRIYFRKYAYAFDHILIHSGIGVRYYASLARPFEAH